MHRIDTKTAQKDKFGAGKNGFTRGNPQTGTPATDLDDDYFDMLQEELCSVVEASGASLEKARHDQLLTALRALLLSRKNPFGDIKSDGTVKTALENLGLGAFISSPSTNPSDFTKVNSPDGDSYLFIANNDQWGAQTANGTAIPLTVERGGSGAVTPEGARTAFGLGDSATKNVGNSAGQIPDMSYFTTGKTSNGLWAKLPSGLIIQTGFGLTASNGTATVSLPIPFTGTFFVVGGSIEGNGPIFVSARGLTQSTIGVVAWGRDGSIQVTNMHWLAIGV